MANKIIKPDDAAQGNLDMPTVTGFGDEWNRFDQRDLMESERHSIFNQYFSEFPWSRIPNNAQGFDLGCGSGRWAAMVAPRVGKLHCIDASPAALSVAKKNLGCFANCELHLASVAAIPLQDGSMDFGYSLGVLHHVPDTSEGLRACARKLKSGAPFLVYLYYAFDNRPWWFRMIWRLSDWGRRLISLVPFSLRARITDVIAAMVYWPLARLALLLEKTGANVERVPLSSYRNLSFYTMRTDALDRFGTRLEQRFSRVQIQDLLEQSGFSQIEFRNAPPYWCAVGIKK